MTNQQFKIQDKTILLLGPVTGLTHTCASFFAENGADVALLTNNSTEAQRFASNISDLREGNSAFGRVLAIDCQFENKKQISESIGKVTEHFGGVDSIIDFHIPSPIGDLNDDENKKNFLEYLDKQIEISKSISDVALDYITQRERGHLIFLTYNLCLYEPLKSSKFDFYSEHTFTTAQKLNKNSTVNCLSLGATEEYLRSRYNNKNAADSLKTIKKTWPNTILIENVDIAHHLSFLSGGLSRGLNGQVININYGLCQ